MKLDTLKRKLVRKGIILGSAILITSALYGIIIYKKTSLEDELQALTRDQMNISSEVETSAQKNVQIVESLNSYRNIPENKLSGVGLDDLIPRIRTARTLKEDLELRYKLSEFSMSFSPMVDLTNELKATFVKVYSNNIEVEFQALTDELALSFCHSMIEEAPGYITISNLSLAKSGDVNQETIDKIRDRELSLPSLVRAKVTFTWRSLGLLPTTSTKTPAATPGASGRAL